MPPPPPKQSGIFLPILDLRSPKFFWDTTSILDKVFSKKNFCFNILLKKKSKNKNQNPKFHNLKMKNFEDFFGGKKLFFKIVDCLCGKIFFQVQSLKLLYWECLVHKGNFFYSSQKKIFQKKIGKKKNRLWVKLHTAKPLEIALLRTFEQCFPPFFIKKRFCHLFPFFTVRYYSKHH